MALASRPSALVSVLALVIAACGNATGDDSTPAPAEVTAPAVLGHVKGAEDAPVKFIFREFPLNDLDVVAYAMANCAGEDKFFDVLDDLFAHQDDVFEASKTGTIKDVFMEIAAGHGIADADAFDACIANRPIRQRIADTMMTGDALGVKATPTFIVNGKVKPADGDVRTPEAFEAYLDGELQKVAQ